MVRKSNIKKVRLGQEKGFSLLEIVLAIFISLLIAVAALSLLNTSAIGNEDKQLVVEAETRTEEALSALSAVVTDLPEMESFTVLEDNVIRPLNCQPQSCDYVVFPETNESFRTSSAKGIPYGSPLPEGSEIRFIRRWRIQVVEGNYNLRRITVAVLKSEQDDKPIVLEETIVGVDR